MDETQRAALDGYCFEDLSVGMSATLARTITEADIVAFAGVSGDTNPVHLVEPYAANTLFKGRIAHAMLSAGYISALFGTRFPGPGAIYVDQSLRFKAPVRPNDTVVVRVEITEMNEAKSRVFFAIDVSVDGKTVITGDAELLVPKRNK